MPTIIDELITVLTFRGNAEGIDSTRTKLRGMQTDLNNVARGIGIVGGAITVAGGLIGRTILGFEGQFNELMAVYLNESEENIGKLRAQALELGSSTSKSASQAAAAQTELARSGLDLNEVLAATPDVLNLAIAGNLSMAEAATLVANTLNSYRLEAEESGRVTDILATTATNASTTVKEIGPAFRQVAPLAREFNIPIEQVAASLGILRTAGLRSEQAGTGLRNIIAILQENPTAEISAAFEEMGLNFDYLKGRLASGDLIGVFEELNAAGLDGASALEIFGRESVIAATSLANAANSGDFDAFIAKINEGAGTADAMREVMESGLPGGVARFMSAIEGLQIALGDAGLTRYISGALQALTDLVRRFEDAPGPVKTVGALLFTLGPILSGPSFRHQGSGVCHWWIDPTDACCDGCNLAVE